MKLNTKDRSVERSGDFQESTFKIAANAKAFEILSSRLYTDTRLAIVRELSTNAYDSHVAAGCPERPFDVHLPNQFTPFFQIRDYGTGLSPENMVEVYTTYFNSTRNDSNGFVGALGLGSKSPFSHTDQFTVTSYWNGMAHIYSAFKNEHGEPSIALVSSCSTEEPNGLEVKINVPEDDSVAFQVAARKVYRFFPVRPNFTGANLEFAEPEEPIFKGDGYVLYNQSSSRAGLPASINAVMGNICYAVSREHFDFEIGTDTTLVLSVDIGDCEIAANREELHYSDATIEYIQTHLALVQEDVRQKIDAAMAGLDSKLEKIKAQRHFKSVLTLACLPADLKLEVKDKYTLKRMEIRGRDDRLYIGRDRFQTRITPRPGTYYTFVHCDVDLKQKYKSRLRKWLALQPSGNQFLCYVEDEQEFIDTFGKPTIKLSDLPEVARAIRVQGTRSFLKKASPDAGWSKNKAMHWDKVDESTLEAELAEENAIAVRRKGYQAYIGDRIVPVETAIAMAVTMGYDSVYGITGRHYDRICKNLELPDLGDEAREFAEAKLDALTEHELAKMEHGYRDNGMRRMFESIAGLSGTCNDLIAMAGATLVSSTVEFMFTLFGLKVPKAPDFDAAFKKKYPLLLEVGTYVAIQDVVEYITLKENK